MSGKTREEKVKTASRFLALTTVIAVLVLDRIFKTLIIGQFNEGEGFPVWRGIFHITRVNNTGAAFGMFREHTPALVLISLICVGVLTIFFFRYFFRKAQKKSQSLLSECAWGLIFAGSIGNLYDRLRYGYVIDFLDFRVWPVFNIADMGICVGVGLVLLHLYLSRQNKGVF